MVRTLKERLKIAILKVLSPCHKGLLPTSSHNLARDRYLVLGCHRDIHIITLAWAGRDDTRYRRRRVRWCVVRNDAPCRRLQGCILDDLNVARKVPIAQNRIVIFCRSDVQGDDMRLSVCKTRYEWGKVDLVGRLVKGAICGYRPRYELVRSNVHGRRRGHTAKG